MRGTQWLHLKTANLVEAEVNCSLWMTVWQRDRSFLLLAPWIGYRP